MFSCFYLCKHSCWQLSSHKQPILIEHWSRCHQTLLTQINMWISDYLVKPCFSLRILNMLLCVSWMCFSILPFYLHLACVPMCSFSSYTEPIAPYVSWDDLICQRTYQISKLKKKHSMVFWWGCRLVQGWLLLL